MTDICLILEGTYPYVSGGVSTWVHQLVSGVPDLRFSILYISTFPNPKREFKYNLPPNVIDIQDLYLHDYVSDPSFSKSRVRDQSFKSLKDLHQQILNKDYNQFEPFLAFFRDADSRLTSRDLFESKQSWEMFLDFYNRCAPHISFVDFFWTIRSIYLPIFKILTSPIPRARLYHTVSTGYAGLAASVAKVVHGTSMVLTEHGIYTHERFLEIAQATWIAGSSSSRFKVQRELPFFKQVWFRFFQLLGQLTYRYSDRIVTLYEGNRRQEILEGADPHKTFIVPNGVNIEKISKSKHRGFRAEKPKVAFIGRVVSIKDVKTFLQAAKIVLAELPEAEFLILGPMEEEPEYVAECLELHRSLELGDKIKFVGKVDVDQYYPDLDLIVLTSLSEAQPYVILEANAIGIPVVSTDVGACREMLEGRLPEDRLLGKSGIVTPVSHPESTAQAILTILKNPQMWNQFSQSGKIRVQRFYDQQELLSQYLNIYEQNMS